MNSIPWHSYTVVLGGICIVVGVLWDISWHSTIGRDTFWTPAHLVIYLGGLLGGLSSGWVVLKTTFAGTPEERASAVRVWGFRGPLGSWISIWGAFAMLISAPFDNWWHNAYGLDVEILSPPHSVLAAGMFGVALGALLVLTGVKNRLPLERQGVASGVHALSFGVLLTMAAVFITEYSYPNHQHSALFYKIACGTFPFYLVAATRSSKTRWAATAASVAYMAVVLAMVWILPLFPAQPMLAPIYNPVDHMVPPPFPFLLVVPAVGMDCAERWLGKNPGTWKDWLLCLAVPLVFLALFFPTQWFFAEFLVSPAADNRLFAGGHFYAYFSRPGDSMRQFWGVHSDPVTATGLGWALLFGVLSARLGLWCGNWMARVRR